MAAMGKEMFLNCSAAWACSSGVCECGLKGVVYAGVMWGSQLAA